MILLEAQLIQLRHIDVGKTEHIAVVLVEPLKGLDGVIVLEQLTDRILIREKVHYGNVSLIFEPLVHEVHQAHVRLLLAQIYEGRVALEQGGRELVGRFVCLLQE